MGSRKINTYVMILLIIGSGIAIDQVALGGTFTNPIFEALFGGGIGGITYGDQVAPLKFTFNKQGTTTALTSVEVFVWFDWDLDGAVDMGEYPNGEIESLTSDGSSGLLTTQVAYPVGSDVYFQAHKATYESRVVVRNLNAVPSSYDGSAMSVPNAVLMLTDTGASRVMVDAVLLVTSSGDYNYTAGTNEPTINFRHTSTSTDAGIATPQWTHWGTGKSYSGTVVVATFTNQDFIDLKPSGYTGFHIGASTTTIWWFTSGYFNDADVTGDSVFELSFTMDISAAGDIATIGMYNDIELDDLAIGVLGSNGVGTGETDIDFVA